MAVHMDSAEGARRAGKSAAAFRTISEVAEELDVPPHVLRFWETKFTQIRPLKRGGGRRYYRPEDVVLLRRIRELLYDEGYTIKGVQRLLKDGIGRAGGNGIGGGLARSRAAPRPPLSDRELTGLPAKASRLEPRIRAEIESAVEELTELRALLHSIRRR